MEVKTFVQFAILLSSVLFTFEASCEDYFPKAKDIRWVSVNFKTFLTWSPKPINYTYTVEYSVVGQDRQRNPYCIRTSATECDLTNELRNLNKTYTVDILSEPLPGVTSDLVEFPFSQAERFCPYKDTEIGGPDFKIVQKENKTKIMLQIQDPLTPLYKDGLQLTIRDIFKNKLEYKIIYSKAGSTGRKEKISNLMDVELTGLDEGESYCLMVAAYIPSRSKRLGQWSKPQCSPRERKTLFDEFTVGAIAGASGLMLAILIIFVTLTVVCYKRCCRKKDIILEKNNPHLSPVYV
ncbi:tissue factor [Esox lucius]|uniref:Tissue factor n=1 Tax=Esox lucius TaxID=8010 RepID=A0A3P9AND3_ESOLU|nr:tissue factor [Esox lucius]